MEADKSVHEIVAISLVLLAIFDSVVGVDNSLSRPLGCEWRPNNASLFCIVFDSTKFDNKSLPSSIGVDKIFQHRQETKFLDIECVSDSNSVPAKDFKSDFYNDYLEHDVSLPQSSTKGLWTQLEFIRIRGCPIHQMAVSEANHWTKPFLKHKEDFFENFLHSTIGGKLDLSRVQSLDLGSNGLNRALTVRAKTFCELSDGLFSINLSSNFYSSLSDIFDSANSVSDKCPFARLKSLNIAGNQIRVLRTTDLSFTKILETLDLSSNGLEQIEIGSLIHLSTLRILDLSNNQLSYLNPAPWYNLTQLHELYLQGNNIERLPEFRKLHNLLVLNISRNSISSIEEYAFGDLKQLVALDLSHNQIVHIANEAFFGLKSLQVLTIANNRLQSISAHSLSHLATLHALILSHNVIENVDQDSFFGLTELRTLSLDRNRIKSLHKEVFAKCTALRDISLAANLFRHFPHGALKSIGQNIQTLDFGENLLDHVHPSALSGLDSLYGLRLAGNKLRNLTDNVFDGVQSLKMLNLASNLIQNISKKAFSSLKDLKALRLDDNQLEDINGLLMNQHHLQWLNISHNHLQWFDYAFIPKSVLWLSLRSNLIEELANYYEMRTGFHLTHLDVGHNKLQRLDRQSLQNSIQEIIADKNQISELAANTFSDLSNLTKINIVENRLERFPLNALALKLASGSAEIYLSGNPLRCDCEMEWIQRINQLAKTSPNEFPSIADWMDMTCSLNNRKVSNSSSSLTLSLDSSSNLVLPVSVVQPSEFICQYQTHCYALCMCCDFFACDCRMKCSDGCDCYHDTTWSANIIQCGNRNHSDIPKFIPMDATSIYLDGNNLGSLTGDEFIGRKHLTSLYLNSSNIVGVSNKTFKGLTELLTLHLSHNLITNLTGREFDELTALRELYLNDNKLSWISEETFAPLVNLRVLHLHNNKISSFPVWSMLRSRSLLKQLTLSGNPWSCQCDFVQKLQVGISEAGPGVVSDFSSLHCVAGVHTSDIGKFNLSCADVMAVSFRSGNTLLAEVIPILAVVAAAIVIVVSLIILAVAIRKPVANWIQNRSGSLKASPGIPQGEYFHHDCLIFASPVDEEFVRQTVITRLEAAKRTPYRTCLYRQGDDLMSTVDNSASVIIVASQTYVEQSNKDNSSIFEHLRKNFDGKKTKPVIIIAMDDGTAKNVRKMIPRFKSSNVLTWGSNDFWQKMMQKLPEPTDKLNVEVKFDKNFDDGMWTYLKGVKVESSLLEPSSAILTENFSSNGPSGDSSLSTHSTDNSGSSVTYGKKRSATLNHVRNSPKLGENALTTLQGTRQKDLSRRHATASRRSDSSRIFENPLDVMNQKHLINSDSDYMSVNDSLVRHDRHRHAVAASTEPIYHTLEDDEDHLNQEDHTVTSDKNASDAKVYINSDLEVVYPPLLSHRGNYLSDNEAEFQHLLRTRVTPNGVTYESDCDDYENDDELLRHHNSYVPSPAPGSMPRRWMTPAGSTRGSFRGNTSEQSFTPRMSQARKTTLPSSGKYRQQPLPRRGSQQHFSGYLI